MPIHAWRTNLPCQKLCHTQVFAAVLRLHFHAARPVRYSTYGRASHHYLADVRAIIMCSCQPPPSFENLLLSLSFSQSFATWHRPTLQAPPPSHPFRSHLKATAAISCNLACQTLLTRREILNVILTHFRDGQDERHHPCTRSWLYPQGTDMHPIRDREDRSLDPSKHLSPHSPLSYTPVLTPFSLVRPFDISSAKRRIPL